MSVFNDFQVVTDEEISYFMPKGFGEVIDNSVLRQRDELIKGCMSKLQGYHVGGTMYSVLTNMGLIEANKSNELTRPTMRGMLFLKQQIGIERTISLEKIGEIRVKVDVDKYLTKYLEPFAVEVTGKNLLQLGIPGAIASHGDKGRSHYSECRDHGVAPPHVALLLMLSYTSFKKQEFHGESLTCWINRKYDELVDKMPPIDLTDADILHDREEYSEEI